MVNRTRREHDDGVDDDDDGDGDGDDKEDGSGVGLVAVSVFVSLSTVVPVVILHELLLGEAGRRVLVGMTAGDLTASR